MHHTKSTNQRKTKTKIKINSNAEELQELLWAEIKVKIKSYVQSLIEETLKVELDNHLQVNYYERSPERKGYRNGYYERRLGTMYGAIPDLAVPRLRRGSYDYQLFDHYQRRSDDVNKAVGTLFLNGVSTRKLTTLTKNLLGNEVSPATVSNIAGAVADEDIKQFQDKPLKDEYRFIFLDGISTKIREIGVERQVLLCALGIKFDGTKEIIGARLSDGEGAQDWEAFLVDLKSRGLKGKKLALITIDGCPGLKAALKTIYPYKPIQRCIAHKLRNVAGKLKRSFQKACMSEAKLIFAASNRTQAIKRFKEWKPKWEIQAEAAVACLERDLNECLTYYQFEKSLWKKIRTTNILERSFREVRRRTRPMSIAISPDSTERLFGSIAKGLNTNWQSHPLKFTQRS
jgi:putative transposase